MVVVVVVVVSVSFSVEEGSGCASVVASSDSVSWGCWHSLVTSSHLNVLLQRKWLILHSAPEPHSVSKQENHHVLISIVYLSHNNYSSIPTHRSPCTCHTTSQITVWIPASARSAVPRQSHWSWGRWRLREGRGGESTSWSKFVLKSELVASLLLTKCAHVHEHVTFIWKSEGYP